MFVDVYVASNYAYQMQFQIKFLDKFVIILPSEAVPILNGGYHVNR